MPDTRGGQRKNLGRRGGERSAAEELAELEELLAAAGVPEDLRRAPPGGSDPQAVLHHLVEVGILPSPQQSLTELLAGWKPLRKPGADPLSAELTGAEFLGVLREATSVPDEFPGLLATLVEQAEGSGLPEALAMLRVLAVLGPHEVRSQAAEAADRLVTAGLTDPPWVSELGTAQVDQCFGYADDLGLQQGVALTFIYRREPHAFVVLIDHSLGGGVKDCFVTDQPGRIRADYQRSAKRHGLEFHDYEPATARAILDRALARRPCPVQDDQVEDVADYLELLRQRVALLPGGDATGATGATGPDLANKRRARAGASSTIHQLKITLRRSKPPIWRRIEVPSGITLQQLHHTIQAAFGWEDCHMWVFTTPVGDYGLADRDLGHRSAASRKLADVASRAGNRIRYTYDFGDNWEHDILVQEVLTAEPGVAYPRCLAGRRAGPPEDCGGVGAYAALLETLADPGDAEHAERLEWLGLESAGEFDPARFDLSQVNRVLSARARVLLKR